MRLKVFYSFCIPFLVLTTLVACDKDFNEIGTDIVGGDNNHYEFSKYTGATIRAFNAKHGAAASHNLPINPLGIYHNPVFGTTKANFVTQLELGTLSLEFNNVDPEEYDTQPTVIDSVVLSVPYFSVLEEVANDGTRTYSLDSIFPKVDSNLKFDLAVYESNYFLRDLDPATQFTEQQSFYSDMNGEIDALKNPNKLNNSPLSEQNTQFFFNSKQIVEKRLDSEGDEVITRSAPGIRMQLRKDFFQEKILNASPSLLETNAVFKNYFRGLYFKVTHNGNDTNLALLNFRAGKITIYYNEDNKITSNNQTTFQRANKTLVLNMTGNCVSLLENSNQNTDYLAAVTNVNEAEKLYLKGGDGSVAVIDIFGPDSDGDGVADEIETIRNNGWLINEANLTFYVDKNTMNNTNAIEPNRIFIYDYDNAIPLSDYSLDASTNGAFPKNNKFVHGGILEKEAVTNGRGVQYKIRITSHVRNLIQKDCTNVRLGVAVTESINNIAFSKLKNPVGNLKKVPTMSVLSPLGTVLQGTSSTVPVAERLKLEIYYTKPE